MMIVHFDDEIAREPDNTCFNLTKRIDLTRMGIDSLLPDGTEYLRGYEGRYIISFLTLADIKRVILR